MSMRNKPLRLWGCLLQQHNLANLTITVVIQVRTRVIFIDSNAFLHLSLLSFFFIVKVPLWPVRKPNSLKQCPYLFLANLLAALALPGILTTSPHHEKVLIYWKTPISYSKHGPLLPLLLWDHTNYTWDSKLPPTQKWQRLKSGCLRSLYWWLLISLYSR